MIGERMVAGMRRAAASGKRIGRPTTDGALLERARAELAKGTGIMKTAKLVGLGTGTVQKLKKQMVAEVHYWPRVSLVS